MTTALGSALVNMLYVLDEPSVGLHPRDIERLTASIRRLHQAGNTVITIEHETAMLAAAERIMSRLGREPVQRVDELSLMAPLPNCSATASLTAKLLAPNARRRGPDGNRPGGSSCAGRAGQQLANGRRGVSHRGALVW
jgi:excinuclease ABC subunit A